MPTTRKLAELAVNHHVPVAHDFHAEMVKPRRIEINADFFWTKSGQKGIVEITPHELGVRGFCVLLHQHFSCLRCRWTCEVHDEYQATDHPDILHGIPQDC